MTTVTGLDALADALGRAARRDAPLGALTTYRVGGPARLLVDVEGECELHAVRRALRSAARSAGPVPVLVLGKGSNILVADAGFPGLVVRPGAGLGEVETGEGSVRAGGAAELPVVARRSVAAGLTGLEWAVGIPGSVGGAVRMNAGGHGSDTASCLVRYRWVDLAAAGATAEDPPGDADDRSAGEDGPDRLAYGYRTSSLRPTEVVVWAELAAGPGDREAGRAALGEIVRWRREHQPGGSNAGSVFTNPPGDSAGRLVEAAGLKGFRLGSARVSEKHANFIQSDEGGSADDVRALMDHVAAVVAARTGVELRPEVVLVGFG